MKSRTLLLSALVVAVIATGGVLAIGRGAETDSLATSTTTGPTIASTTTTLATTTTSAATTTSAPTTTTTTEDVSTTRSATTSSPSGNTSTTAIPTPTTSPVATNPPNSKPFRSSISTVTADDLHASWRPGCPLDVDLLRAVDVTHWGSDGKTHTGRMIVASNLAEDVVEIMEALFAAGFPIEGMEPVDAYDGDDDRSMAANNTSAFNCRAVTGGSSWSEHSYGRAIDVNPLVNPYVRGGTVLPPEGARYADRSLDESGMIHGGDVVVDTFAAHGWVWGGTWSSPKDYQHFSTSGR